MSKKLDTFIGAGEIYLQKRGVIDAPMLSIGNVSKCDLEWDTEKKKLTNYMSVAGGTLDSFEAVNGGNVQIEITQFFPANLALLTYGTQRDTEKKQDYSEMVTAVKGSLHPLKFLPDRSAIEVYNEDESITYTSGVDYLPCAAGFKVLEGGAISTGQKVKVIYDVPAQYSIQALTDSAAEFRCVIQGLNKANAGSPSVITLHRVKFGPGGLQIITDDFRRANITGEILQAPEIEGIGTSQYAEIKQLAG